MNDTLYVLFTALVLMFLFFNLDDFYLDIVSFVYRLGPQRLQAKELQMLHALKQKRIAILIPAWKEKNIVAKMVLGNYAAIDYENYQFIVGVYPNDPETLKYLEEASLKVPNLSWVVGKKPGPTSKGQILNEIFQHLLSTESYDAFLLHDAEDVIHPLSLKLFNLQLEKHDYIQIPVFSLAVKPYHLVRGIYADEFAESHLKELLVRQRLDAFIPSAGVGTCLSTKLVHALQRTNLTVFQEAIQTEDYVLGLEASRLGFSTHFCCFYQRENSGSSFIATREFFPSSFVRSIRQKSRWVYGIAFQAHSYLGWAPCKNLFEGYFLYRDRKVLISHFVSFLGLIFTAYLIAFPSAFQQIHQDPPLWFMIQVNLFFTLYRIVQKARFTYLLYGRSVLYLLPVRWFAAIVINAFSVFRAYHMRWKQFQKKEVVWQKTEHELPELFGAPS